MYDGKLDDCWFILYSEISFPFYIFVFGIKIINESKENSNKMRIIALFLLELFNFFFFFPKSVCCSCLSSKYSVSLKESSARLVSLLL